MITYCGACKQGGSTRIAGTAACGVVGEPVSAPGGRPMPDALWSPPPLLCLLQAAAQGRRDLALGRFPATQVRWALQGGLGPLLAWATRADPQAPASPHWPLLRGAELTARVLAAEQREAVSEIL